MRQAHTNKSIEMSYRNAQRILFDIIVCTSIGAINLAILVGYYLKDNNSWAGSVEKLLEFWEGLMCPTIANNLFNNNTVVSSTYTGSF